MWIYTLLPQIINMSLTAGIVIVLVLIIRLPLRKVPKIFSYALWVVVLFRLLSPVSISSDFSLLGLFHAPAMSDGSMVYIPTDIVHKANPQVNLPLPGANKAINNTLAHGDEQAVADPLEAPMAIATMIWLGGMASILIYNAVSYLTLRRKLFGAVLLRENIYLVDHINTPFVIGVIGPKIYIPSSLSAQELGYIILHEETHIRRHDNIVKLIMFLALVLHWFNPLVWVAFACCAKDMEMSCDEAVIKKMGNGIRTEYTTSLLSLTAGRKVLAVAPLAFGENDIKSRINNVLNYKKPAKRIIIATALIVAVICIGLIFNPMLGNKQIKMDNKVNLSDIEQMNIGAEMPMLLYGDKNVAIMQGTFGLLVYNLNDSIVTDRLSYDQLKEFDIEFVFADVSQDGETIYFGNEDIMNISQFTHQYNIKSNTIKELSDHNVNMFKPTHISSGYSEQYDKYFNFNYLINNSIVEMDHSFMYLRANTDWSMKSLQLVIYQYADETSKVYNVFN